MLKQRATAVSALHARPARAPFTRAAALPTPFVGSWGGRCDLLILIWQVLLETFKDGTLPARRVVRGVLRNGPGLFYLQPLMAALGESGSGGLS